MKRDIFAAMSKDGGLAQITITADGLPMGQITMGADELLTVIQGLRDVRAAMADKIPPLDPTAPIFADVTRLSPYVVGREHVVSKEVYIAFRHPGYGWLCFTMEEEPAAKMVLLMSQNVASMRPRIAMPPKPGIIT